MAKRPLLLLAAAFALFAGPASAQTTLRFGLAEDPDVLDPTLARTFVGRIVFSALCDKLFDIDEKLNIVPQLATAHEWSGDNKSVLLKIRQGVTFHDGEKLDAEAVKFSIERHKTMQGSNRRGELAPVTSVEVVDPQTVKLNLSAPFAPLLAQLADRAGMIVSPKAAQAAGDKFGTNPVCAGPFKFVERIAQDRIVLEKFANYWDKGRVHIDRIVYLPIVDATVRLANLRSGQLDFIERMAADGRAVVQERQPLQGRQDRRDRLPGHHHQHRQERDGAEDGARPRPARARGVRAGPRPRRHRAGRHGRRGAARQPVGRRRPTPSTPRTSRSRSATSTRAKALLKEAGVTNPTVTLMTATTSDAQKIAQVVQAMTQEAGFEVKIQSTEFSTSLNLADKGEFDAYVLAWSGRADPDGNLFSFYGCKQPLNYSGYLQAGDRRPAQAVARAARPEGAPEDLRADRRDRRSRRTGRSSTCTTATGCGVTRPSSAACGPFPTGLSGCRT